MIKIAKDFGGIDIGDRNLMTNSPKPLDMFKYPQPNQNWIKLSEVVSYGPKRMIKFKDIIDEAYENLTQDY